MSARFILPELGLRRPVVLGGAWPRRGARLHRQRSVSPGPLRSPMSDASKTLRWVITPPDLGGECHRDTAMNRFMLLRRQLLQVLSAAISGGALGATSQPAEAKDASDLP